MGSSLKIVGPATVEAEMNRQEQLASLNSVAEHMSKVHASNLKELGEQLDAAHDAVAAARHKQREAENTAKQLLSEARAQASAIRAEGERQAVEVIAGTNATQRPDAVEMPFEPNAMRKKKKAAEAALEDFHGSLR